MPTLPRLKAYRERAMLSQRALAAKAKVSQPTVPRAERGDPVTFVTARKLARALRVTPQALAGIDDQKRAQFE